LRKHYARPPLKHVRQIAIDEICIGRGHRYLTLVIDLATGAILFVGEGKKAESLAPFWRRVRAARVKIESVAMDLSPAYIAAVERHLPNATIVHDRFHLVKLMNDKLTQLRRELYHQATALQKKALKGSRWLLMMNPENLDPVKGEPGRLQAALELNEPLAIAYYLKEDPRQLWEQPDKETARLKLLDWYHQAMASGIRLLQQMARTLLAHQWRIFEVDPNRETKMGV
jgi:transposase